MNGVMVVLILVLNFGISWFNAWSVGRSWAETKAVGGWSRVVIWCAAIMSACGFTWCYLILLALGAGAIGLLEPQYVQAALEIGYLVLIGPILGSGLGIWIDSLTTAWRRRSVGSVAVAGWNTFAQVHNTYQAAKMIPEILEHLGEVFKSKNGGKDVAKAKALLLIIILVVLAICAGTLTTVAIVRSSARKYAGKALDDMKSRERSAA